MKSCATRRLLATVPLLLLLGTGAGAQPFDHLQCFKIRDTAPKVPYTATLTPSDGAFPVATGCSVRVPAKLLCVDVQKSNVTPPPPGAGPGTTAQKYLCYKTKCPKAPQQVPVADQFGLRFVTIKTTGLLCAPFPVPQTTTSTTATSTTSTSLGCTPSGPEVCDNVDNDCNGMVDDGLGSSSCGTGQCQNTVPNCVMGQPQTCTPGMPSAEVCDGIDNNCNGIIDDGAQGTGQPCGTGACSGTTVCQGFVIGCNGPPPTAEVCDNIDNDCDGMVDDGLGTTTCGTGQCQNTVQNCVGGVPQSCTPGTPSPEVCDGIDNNCNGNVDDGLPPITCGTGQCQNTVPSCVNGMPNTCTPGTPSAEACGDMIDNDCDGLVDEGCCAGNGDCSPQMPVCSGGTCGACATTSQCTAAGWGSACSAGQCLCTTNTDCANSRVDTCSASLCTCGVTGGPCPVGQTCSGGTCM
jgi:hypothetical protein